MIVQLQCPHCKEIVEGERFDSDGHISDGAIATRARASASRALAEHVCLPVTAEKLLRREQLAAAMNDRHVFAFRDSDIEEEGFTSRLKKILGADELHLDYDYNGDYVFSKGYGAVITDVVTGKNHTSVNCRMVEIEDHAPDLQIDASGKLRVVAGEGPLFESMYRHRVPTPEETFTCDDELQRNRDMYDCSSIRVRSIDGAVFHVSVTPELVRQVNDAAAHRAAITKKLERSMAKLLDFGMPAYITKPKVRTYDLCDVSIRYDGQLLQGLAGPVTINTSDVLMPTTETVPQVTYIIDKCECGAEAVGEPHYRWCPKHTK